MGEAKRRGTREERAAVAIAAGREKQRPEPSYRPRMVLRTSALDYLWGKFRIFGDITLEELRAKAIAEQQRLAAERAAKEQANEGADSVAEGEAVSDRVTPESGSPEAGVAVA